MDRQRIARELVRLAKELLGEVTDMTEVEPVESEPSKTRRTKKAGVPSLNKFVDKYETDDYPYGRFRTTAKFWVEGGRGKQRVVRVTINPKTGRPNKPHKTTYSDAAILGLSGDRVYPITGSPGMIHIWKSDMKHIEDTVHTKDPAYRKLADALGIKTGPRSVEVKKKENGASIDGLQGQRTTIREILEIGGLSRDDIADVDNVRRKETITESIWTVRFKSDRPDYIIEVFT